MILGENYWENRCGHSWDKKWRVNNNKYYIVLKLKLLQKCSICVCTYACMYSWNVEFLFISWKHFLSEWLNDFLSEWLITLSQNICFFFLCKYILYPFIIQQEMLKWDEKRKDVPSLQPHCTFLHICILKMSCRKCRKWYFRDPKFKHFQGDCPPETPLVWRTFSALTFLPLRRPSKSHTLLVK